MNGNKARAIRNYSKTVIYENPEITYEEWRRVYKAIKRIYKNKK